MIIVEFDFKTSCQNLINQRQWFSNLYLLLILICDAVFNEIMIKKNKMILIFVTLDFTFLKKTFLVEIKNMLGNELMMCLISVCYFKIIILYLIKFVVYCVSTWIKLFSKNQVDFSRFCKMWLFKYFMKNLINFILKSSTAMIELINESMTLMHSTLNIISFLWVIEACVKGDSLIFL